jgi:hypothetical protein
MTAGNSMKPSFVGGIAGTRLFDGQQRRWLCRMGTFGTTRKPVATIRPLPSKTTDIRYPVLTRNQSHFFTGSRVRPASGDACPNPLDLPGCSAGGRLQGRETSAAASAACDGARRMIRSLSRAKLQSWLPPSKLGGGEAGCNAQLQSRGWGSCQRQSQAACY